MSDELASPPSKQLPQGERFSLVHLERGEPTHDSERMRHRIGASINDFRILHEGLGTEIQRRIGIDLDNVRWTTFLKKIALRDVLDLVTVAYGLLARTNYVTDARKWLVTVQQILIEENVTYRVDAEGGVHFYIDNEFAFNNAATLAALQPARYANARHAFESGQASLREVPPDGKGAIRATFNALEAMFRLMCQGTSKLTWQEAEPPLRTLVQRAYAGDAAASSAAGKLLTGFREWLNAAHVYRHEQGVPDIVAQPPVQLAIYLVSTGAAHLRWLAELDTSAAATM